MRRSPRARPPRARLPPSRRLVAWRIAFSLIAVVVVLSLMVTLAFGLTAWLDPRTGRPPALAAQVINTLLGFLFLGVILFTVGQLITRRQMEWFRPLLDAMERIARGDFSARVPLDFDPGSDDPDNPMARLAHGMNKMAANLDQMEQMRQEFISNVSHEIQSPLTSIRGFARALREDDLDPDTRRHYLSIIEAESVRLSKLSDNLLQLASLDSEQLKLEPRLYRLDKQLRSLILACEPQWAEKNLEMDVALDEVSLSADEDLLSQVWINLIHNSIKFTPPGGCVRVALARQGGQVQVSVADSGIGISPEDQAHIFERFYKADKARRRSEGGTGLGLSIAKKIVELHHGTLSVQSQVGQGTTFTVTLPEKP